MRGVDHDAIDHDISRAGEDREMARARSGGAGRAPGSRLQRLRAWERLGIYRLSGLVLAGPTLVALVIWPLMESHAA